MKSSSSHSCCFICQLIFLRNLINPHALYDWNPKAFIFSAGICLLCFSADCLFVGPIFSSLRALIDFGAAARSFIAGARTQCSCVSVGAVCGATNQEPAENYKGERNDESWESGAPRVSIQKGAAINSLSLGAPHQSVCFHSSQDIGEKYVQTLWECWQMHKWCLVDLSQCCVYTRHEEERRHTSKNWL